MNNLEPINWIAIDRCWEEFARMIRTERTPLHVFTYQQYMLKEWGIEHRNHHIRVVDKKKYMMFLLRFG